MSFAEKKYTGEFILSESDGNISRDDVTVTAAAAANLDPGQVLAKVGTKYVPFDDTATDGSEVAKGILYNRVDNSAGVAPADFDAVIINWTAEVRGDDLVWGAADDAVGIPQLEALGIKVRS